MQEQLGNQFARAVARGLDALTAPHPSLTRTEDRHGAHLLAILLLVHMAGLAVILTVLRIATWHIMRHDILADRDTWDHIGLTVLLVLPLLLLRAGHYRTAAAAYIAQAAAVPLVAPFAHDPNAEIGFLAMLVLAPLIASMVFPPRAVVVILITGVALAAIRLEVSDLPARTAGTGASILIVVTVIGLLLLVIQSRARVVERLRLEHLHEQEQALQRTSERLRLLLANSLDVILGLDRHATIVFAAGEVEGTLGRASADLLGHPLEDLVHPDDVARVRGLLTGLLGTSGLPVRAEWRHRMAGGSDRWLEVLIANHLDRPGVATMIMNLRDVTARRTAEAQRADLEGHLQHMARAELTERMAGGVAHDFNNLLSVMVGNLENARLESAQPDRLAVRLAGIGDAVREATTLTRQLLRFSRREVTTHEAIHPAAVVEGLADALRQVGGPGIRLELVVDHHAGWVRFDPGGLERIVMDLVMNAHDAMPAGGNVTIRVDRMDLPDAGPDDPALPPGARVRLAVTDTGSGMTEEVQRHLFEPFFTTKPRRIGTGLGLATMHSAVTRIGGTVDVTSAAGRGTTVSLLLPLAADPGAGPATPHREAVAAPPAGVARTVLYAEDNDALRDMTQEFLVRMGYRVLAAPDGAAALGIATRTADPIDLLLTDILMPGLNGLELAAAVAPFHPETRVLFTSGYADDVLASDDPGGRARQFLPKPYSSAQLARMVTATLTDS